MGNGQTPVPDDFRVPVHRGSAVPFLCRFVFAICVYRFLVFSSRGKLERKVPAAVQSRVRGVAVISLVRHSDGGQFEMEHGLWFEMGERTAFQ